MASVIESKQKGNHLFVVLKLDMEEAISFSKGMLSRIHLIPEDSHFVKSAVYEKGKKGNTKYFLVPKELRKDVKMQKKISCVKLDATDKIIWAFFMDKFK